MPTAPRYGCRVPGCPHRNPCPVHARLLARPAWERPTPPPPRLRGRALQRRRARVFDREPLCVTCQAVGRVTLATILDHVIPLAEGGPDTEANTQPLCRPCHDAKSQAEAARGSRRKALS